MLFRSTVKEIDAKGRLVLPAYCDSHTHLVYAGSREIEYIDKIKKSSNFQAGYASDRQLSFGMVDMAWHTITEPVTEPLADFEQRAMGKTEIMPLVKGSAFSPAFGHIFAGGYAAGYYGYKWAEVLDADAFSLFKQNGIFDKATAESFRRNVLEKGASENPMTLYKRFQIGRASCRERV